MKSTAEQCFTVALHIALRMRAGPAAVQLRPSVRPPGAIIHAFKLRLERTVDNPHPR